MPLDTSVLGASPSRWGSPFYLPYSRVDAVRECKRSLRIQAELLAALAELRAQRVRYCPPDQRCHADVFERPTNGDL